MAPPSKGAQIRRSRRAHSPLTAALLTLVIGRFGRYNPSVLEFRILGLLECLADDGEPLALAGKHARAVLVLLLLRANQVVSTDFLVDAVWGEQPPRTVATSLQNTIGALRRVLGADLLQFRAPGYRLAVDPASIDLNRFERPVATARTRAESCSTRASNRAGSCESCSARS